MSGHRRILWQRRESNLDELLGIERSVIISSGCNRRWDNYTSSINSLPNVTSIYSSRNLTNQHWRQSFSSQWLVDTKEVDLCHLHWDPINTHMNWHTRDEAVEPILFTTSDPEEPIFVVTRWSKCPLKEFDGVKYRTPKFKESFRYIYKKINELQRVENKTGDKISNVSRLVPLHPLELFF